MDMMRGRSNRRIKWEGGESKKGGKREERKI